MCDRSGAGVLAYLLEVAELPQSACCNQNACDSSFCAVLKEENHGERR
jgi:hypothetical protein